MGHLKTEPETTNAAAAARFRTIFTRSLLPPHVRYLLHSLDKYFTSSPNSRYKHDGKGGEDTPKFVRALLMCAVSSSYTVYIKPCPHLSLLHVDAFAHRTHTQVQTDEALHIYRGFRVVL